MRGRNALPRPKRPGHTGGVGRGLGRPRYAPHLNLSLIYTASFAAFTGRALTIFRAGLALKTVGSFVNGLMPFRSLVAGFFMTTNLAKPGTTKAPFFFSSL